ncbi:MAG: hypothetical protein CVV44_07395 [Spirochaetae bacterium HGW-Spirochaetae-1]|nr:MAG: hypothetical protein CVV44_07395 [Spirochaetae bacterium HGW-Spirochaetae-1]
MNCIILYYKMAYFFYLFILIVILSIIEGKILSAINHGIYFYLKPPGIAGFKIIYCVYRLKVIIGSKYGKN